jgi:hypothetical protein
MTPKEKAEELVNKYYKLFSVDLENTICIYESKHCSLLLVDEIIKELTEEISPSVHGFRHKFYLEVKQEIENL